MLIAQLVFFYCHQISRCIVNLGKKYFYIGVRDDSYHHF